MQYKAHLVGPGPWGFRLTGGKENNQPLIISRTTAGGKAVKADIRPDDILTAINGEPTFDMTLARAQEKIRITKGDLYLTMMRRGADGNHNQQKQQPHQQSRAAPPPAPPAPPMPYQQPARSPAPYQQNARSPAPYQQHARSPAPYQQHVRQPAAYQQNAHSPVSYTSPPALSPVRSPQQVDYARPPQLFGKASPTTGSQSFRPVISPSPTSNKKPFTYGYDPASARSPGFNKVTSPNNDSGPRVEIRREPQYQPHHQPAKIPSYYRRIDPTHGAEEKYEEPHQPSPTAKVVHLQYNSPVGIYSADNIADSFKGQTTDMISTGQAGVVRGNSPGYSPSHMNNSPGHRSNVTQVYPAVLNQAPLPRSVDANSRLIPQRDEMSGDYYGYKNPGSQSKSFRVLQQHVAQTGEMEYGQEL
ncbi:uncharacterized protein LOC100378508 [Saccoglossus kowalevskii]|uniref:Mucin-1-like n=1 Tax=Saccoglossus kowalevskii TaxID=10224 RepID=A0ABM0GL16_SACKO|nr:PREDICTED: mucin-1-like [Saccoglossus kowalevskii]